MHKPHVVNHGLAPLKVSMRMVMMMVMMLMMMMMMNLRHINLD